MPLFRGLVAFPITPADAAGRVAADDLAALLEQLVQGGVDSVGLLGSTGTYAYLTRDERLRAIRTAAARLAGRVPLMVGVGALRTDEAVALARDAAGAGAEALLLAPVSYTPLTEEEVFAHVATVAAATDLPLCLYNNPATTRFTFTADLVVRLAALPHVVALKDPAPAPAAVAEAIGALRRRLPAAFSIGYSGDWHAAEALLAGAEAWYGVLGGLLPRPAAALARAALAGDRAEVARLDAALQPFWSLFKAFGSLRVVYAAAHLLGVTDAQPPRPLLPLGGAERERVAQALAALTDGQGRGAWHGSSSRDRPTASA